MFNNKLLYPNMKYVRIKRQMPEKSTIDNGRKYLCAYSDNIYMAMNDLTNTEFKVYMIMLCNADNYKLGFSPAYIHKIAGIHEDTARKCFNNLIRKGYITLKDEELNEYEFNEVSSKYKYGNEEKIDRNRRQFIDYEFD